MATQAWTGPAVQTARERGFEQIDLDDLVGEPPSAVRVGLDCVQSVATLMSVEDRALLRASLIIPMDVRERLDLTRPDMSLLLDQPWAYGPGRSVPGVYVTRMDHLHWDEVDEEYRCQVRMPIAGWYAEYRTWRRQDEATAGWEFDRAMYVWPND